MYLSAFIIGSVIGLGSLMYNSSCLIGLNSAELFCLILAVILIWGGFNSLLCLILQILFNHNE